MRRKIKCYTAYTTFLYRLLGVTLIPCAFWVLCGSILWLHYGRGGEAFSVGKGYALYFMFSVYIVLYEIFTDFWVLGGCFSDAGRGLRYFMTSHSGVEVMRNIVSVDLMRRFLYCMIYSGSIFWFTGWKTSLVLGLAMYCVIVGVLHGSRHIDGLQRNTGIAILAQIGMTLVNIANLFLLDLAGDGEGIMLAVLAVLYGIMALWISRWMVRRVTARIQRNESFVPPEAA
ncbi:MAG: hypothetical protein NC331_02475 [Lachnospiraceae bacterium]|nr:hypothetical protein [Lachnospiraceae bacterium]MCM1238231.1 hypothetical protein [Lachnospiraceae bacterium]